MEKHLDSHEIITNLSQYDKIKIMYAERVINVRKKEIQAYNSYKLDNCSTSSDIKS